MRHPGSARRRVRIARFSPTANLLLLGVVFGGAVGAQIVMRQLDASRPSLLAQALRPAKDLFPGDKDFVPVDVAKLLETVSVKIISPSSGAAPEPEIPEGIAAPLDPDAIGFGKSTLLVDSRWATVRYLGEAPAGRGLSGAELDAAQKSALGKKDDTIPVVTAAVPWSRMVLARERRSTGSSPAAARRGGSSAPPPCG